MLSYRCLETTPIVALSFVEHLLEQQLKVEMCTGNANGLAHSKVGSSLGFYSKMDLLILFHSMVSSARKLKCYISNKFQWKLGISLFFYDAHAQRGVISIGKNITSIVIYQGQPISEKYLFEASSSDLEPMLPIPRFGCTIVSLRASHTFTKLSPSPSM